MHKAPPVAVVRAAGPSRFARALLLSQGSINAPCVILDGASLELCVSHHQRLFMEVACAAPTVICCRCTPTQKADIVRLIRQTQSSAITAAIGDGGNDVGMIQAAHVGIGIEGREGKQAALAADFSLRQFSHLGRLVLWHGRNCYLRSATLSQFVIHRGLIISVIHAVFSALFYFAPIALYNGILVAGRATAQSPTRPHDTARVGNGARPSMTKFARGGSGVGGGGDHGPCA
eukprot:6206345-Pleurochrysis_carterae.AAC.2